MDIMAMVVGVVLGLGAAIPSSLLVLYLLSRRVETLPPEPEPPESGVQVYIDRAVFVSDVRRLVDSGAVMTLADRHAMEIRR
mgnify:CR=1 FL=1